MKARIIKLPARVGMMSLVGVGGTPPHSWGNYFNLAGDEHFGRFGPRVLNMWAENLDALVKDGTLNDKMIEIKLYEDGDNEPWCIVVDERVPPEYLYNKLCFTGTRYPPVDVARDMYETVGDPDNELEQITDPKSYWEKRGATWNESGWVTYSVKAESRDIPDIKFTVEN